MRTVKDLFSFYGRMRRTTYGYFVLFSAVAALGLVVAVGTGHEPPEELQFVLFVVGGIAFVVWVIANLSFTVRRLHDMSLSGWICLLLILARFIPFVSWLILAWLLFRPGTKGSNSFGPNPRDPEPSTIAEVFEAPPEDGETSSPSFSDRPALPQG